MAEKVEVLNSFDPGCNELKHAYDSCFNTWFAESFLKNGGGAGGDAANRSTPCDALLKAYSDCVKAAMKKNNMDPKRFARYWENSGTHGNDGLLMNNSNPEQSR